MSAFLVSSDHVDALVTAAALYDDHAQLPAPNWAALEAAHPGAFTLPARNPDTFRQNVAKAFPHELARALLVTNLESLRALYLSRPGARAEAWPDCLAHHHEPCKLEPVSALKQVHVYAYQAGDAPDWEAWAQGFCRQLESLIISNLPGYQAAPWGL